MAGRSIDNAVQRSDENGRPLVKVGDNDAGGRQIMLVCTSFTPEKGVNII